jgi:hypothetical protein
LFFAKFNNALLKKIYCLLSGLFLLSTVSLFAQNDSTEDFISPERPGLTNPPSVVPKKHLQIESGFYYESDKIKNTDIKTDNYLYPTTLFRYGLMKNFELRLQVDIAGFSNSVGTNKLTESGLNPVIIGAKFYICGQKKARPESAFVFSLTLPYLGRDDFQPQYPAPGLAFYFLNTLNNKWSIGYNLAMQWSGNDANPTSIVTFSPAYNISKRVSAFGEIYGYFQKYSVPDIRCDAGIAYIALPNLQLDVSAGPGLAGPTTNYFVSAGISIRLPR